MVNILAYWLVIAAENLRSLTVMSQVQQILFKPTEFILSSRLSPAKVLDAFPFFIVKN